MDTHDPEIQEEMKSEDDYHYPYEAQLQIPVKISVTELKRMELQAQKLEEDVWAEATDVPEVFGQAEEIQSISVEYMAGAQRWNDIRYPAALRKAFAPPAGTAVSEFRSRGQLPPFSPPHLSFHLPCILQI